MVDAGVEPSIINDHEHQDFFFAIVKNGNGAIPEIKPEELAAWRSYVLHGAAVRKWRQPAVMRGSTVSQEKRENDLMWWVSRASGQVRQRWRTLFGHSSGDVAGRTGAPPTPR